MKARKHKDRPMKASLAMLTMLRSWHACPPGYGYAYGLLHVGRLSPQRLVDDVVARAKGECTTPAGGLTFANWTRWLWLRVCIEHAEVTGEAQPARPTSWAGYHADLTGRLGIVLMRLMARAAARKRKRARGRR